MPQRLQNLDMVVWTDYSWHVSDILRGEGGINPRTTDAGSGWGATGLEFSNFQGPGPRIGPMTTMGLPQAVEYLRIGTCDGRLDRMAEKLTAPRLEQHVDALTCAALKVGTGGKVSVQSDASKNSRQFTVDRIVLDENGYPSEVWFSADRAQSTLDRMRGMVHKDLLRVSRYGGDVRRCVTRITYQGGKMSHAGYREDVGAPRMSQSVATFKYPMGPAAEWLRSYSQGTPPKA